jgi:hypothetical protein
LYEILLLGAFLALRAKNRAFRSKSSESADALSCGLSATIPCARTSGYSYAVKADPRNCLTAIPRPYSQAAGWQLFNPKLNDIKIINPSAFIYK